MAKYRVRDWEELMECPYDKTHMIRVKRMQYHLMDCRRNFPHMEMEQCPFNARHQVPVAEFNYHKTNCPDRALIEQDMVHSNQKIKKSGSYTMGDCDASGFRSDWVAPEPSEDWDSDCTNEQPFKWNAHVEGEYWTASGSTYGSERPPVALFQQQHAQPHTTPMIMQRQSVNDKPQRKPRAANAPASSVFALPPTRGVGAAEAPPVDNTAKLQQLARGRGSAMAQQQAPAVGRGAGRTTANGPVPEVPYYPSAQPAPGFGRGMPLSQAQTASNGGGSQSRMAAAIPGLSQRAGGARSKGPQQGQPENKPRTATASAAFSLGGVGRGIGRGQAFSITPGQSQQAPGFIVPNVNTKGSNKNGSIGSSDQTSEASLSESLSDFSISSGDDQAAKVNGAEEKKKKIKKLQKKLREIEALEARLLSGKQPNPEETVKLGQKLDIQHQITSLGLEQ